MCLPCHYNTLGNDLHMKVLITGGTGFVGSHTVAAVHRAGHEIRLFVRSRSRVEPALRPHDVALGAIECFDGDVNDVGSVRRALDGCDAVIHAGSAYAYGIPFWKASQLMTTNVDGTAHVLQEAHARGLDPIVHVSSIFGIVQPRSTELTEEAPVAAPPEPYGKSKARSERIARDLQEAGAPVVITYPGAVWGPNDPYFGETALLASSILKGQMRFVVNGRLPSSDVREVAQLHAAVLTPGLGPRRYLVPSHSPSLVDIIALIAAATAREIRTTVLPTQPVLASLWLMGLIQKVSPFRMPLHYSAVWLLSCANAYGPSRAEADFGILPRPLEETVRDTLSWLSGTGKVSNRLLGRIGHA